MNSLNSWSTSELILTLAVPVQTHYQVSNGATGNRSGTVSCIYTCDKGWKCGHNTLCHVSLEMSKILVLAIPLPQPLRKGLAKQGNIVTETLLRTQMFPSLVTQANFASRKQENVFESSQKHLFFTGANFASETHVSQFSHGGNNFVLPASLATQETLQETMFLQSMFPSLARKT